MKLDLDKEQLGRRNRGRAGRNRNFAHGRLRIACGMGQDGRPLLSSRCSLDSEMSSLLARGACWPVLTIALAVWHHWFVGLAFFECGLFMAQTTLHLLLSHYYRRSTTCLFCGRSYLPKGHSKGPDVVGVPRPYALCSFLYPPPLDLSPPVAVVLPSTPALVIPLSQGLDREHPPRPAPASLAF